MSYTARHRGIDTASAAGLRPPRSPSPTMPAGARGAAWHYIGANFSPSNHEQCRANWRNSQDHHMRPGGLRIANGANTIGYNVGTCPHGIILLGRGWTARPIAHGPGNPTHFAIQWMLGPGNTPTTEMIEAALWATAEFRRRGAGREVRPHSSFMATSCPGDRVRALIPDYHLRDIPSSGGDIMSWKEDLSRDSGSPRITNLADSTLPETWGRGASSLLGYAAAAFAYLARSKWTKPAGNPGEWRLITFVRWAYAHALTARNEGRLRGAVLDRVEEKLTAVLAAQQGADAAEVLTRIDQHAAEAAVRYQQAEAQRAELADRLDGLGELVEQARSGELDAGAVVDELSRRLAAGRQGPTDDDA